MMNRRRFLRTVSVGLLAAPLAAEAQPAGKVYRLGFIAITPVAKIMSEPTQINLKTAKALGLTIPRSLLLRADRIIE